MLYLMIILLYLKIPKSKIYLRQIKIKYQQLIFIIPSICENHKCKFFIFFHKISNQLILVFGFHTYGPKIKFFLINVSTIRYLQLASGHFSNKRRVYLQFFQLLNLSLNRNYLKEYNYSLFQHVSTRFSENFIDKIFFLLKNVNQPSFVLELIFIDEEGSKNDASKLNSNQKIRKCQKIFEKEFNKINQKEEKIEND
ncbi:unnamed protein product [Paramecium primaurelia]|uniref:Uncharacterized protein n=1 Tax=Paramecium primaurelia TaxID=5886 RepID=A0A8S1Q8Z7_PARPR|nr:unnamed protein product [Paramecium primaurelia]